MNYNKEILLFIFGYLFLLGCQNNVNNIRLAEIDSLIVEEKYDSAYYLLNLIDDIDFNKEDDNPHYNLLRVQVSYLVDQPLIASDSLIDGVISYYIKHLNNEKLADAYYYKGYGLCKRKEYQNCIIQYKKAEQYAEEGNCIRQKYKIAEGISYVNGLYANYNIQLHYAKKTLALSKEIQNKRWVAYSYFWLGFTYYNMEKDDSVLYYFDKMMPYIEYVDPKNKPIFLSNIGYMLRDTNPTEAKQYLEESLNYKELTNTYEYLAEIYYDNGDKEKAYELRKKALLVQDATPKDDVLHNIIEYDMERGKTDSICERINEIIAIRDSIDAKLKNDTIKDLQTRFDHEVEMREKDRAVIKWQWVAIALVILLLVGVIYYLVRKYQNRIQLQKYQMQIHDYMEQIRALSGKKDQTAEIDRLNKEIKKIMDEKSPRLAQGRILYDKVVANENMGKWRLDDVEKFIEYYTATNYRVVNRLQSIPRRDELTPHRLLYLILVEMKKTDQQICFIQGITKECLRVYRFRTQPIEKEETSEESDESL